MSESHIQLPPNSTGSKMDTRQEATYGNHRQVINIADPSVTDGIAPVDAIRGLSVNVTNDAPLSVFVKNQGSRLNVFGEQSVPTGTETALVTYTVPTTKILSITGMIGWGAWEGEFLIRVDGSIKGGGRSSPAMRTLPINFSDAPISAASGQVVTLTAFHDAGNNRTMRANLLGGIL